MKVVLVTCVKEKLDHPALAKDLYQGELFDKLMQYAKAQNPDKIFILSGKYGLLHLEDVIEPYDKNLHEVADSQLKKWSKKVLRQLEKEAHLDKDQFLLLCSPIYAKYITPNLTHYQMPILRVCLEFSDLAKMASFFAIFPPIP